jgi:hypothetical protein
MELERIAPLIPSSISYRRLACAREKEEEKIFEGKEGWP